MASFLLLHALAALAPRTACDESGPPARPARAAPPPAFDESQPCDWEQYLSLTMPEETALGLAALESDAAYALLAVRPPLPLPPRTPADQQAQTAFAAEAAAARSGEKRRRLQRILAGEEAGGGA